VGQRFSGGSWVGVAGGKYEEGGQQAAFNRFDFSD
jgi:hypothetical protein